MENISAGSELRPLCEISMRVSAPSDIFDIVDDIFSFGLQFCTAARHHLILVYEILKC